MELFYHPLSRYSQKVLIALYEKQANFYPRVIELSDPFSRNEFKQQYPLGKLPLLKTRTGELLPESSIIIDYIDHEFATGTRLLPQDYSQRLQVRLYDRLIDNDLNNPLYLLEQMDAREEENPVKEKQLEKEIMLLLEEINDRLKQHHWLCGDAFTMADCALIPCLIHARERFKLYQLDPIDRYLNQANTRGAWIQVQEEIELTRAAVQAGFRPIP
ncbi:glutathione S-transferase family protein [Shewanella insulae]|uniref:Glutathione S-transferase family protein n=1 Tax=Shewanella insulae TaxID=2681496 RepID=A0A6L7HX75_9GAMM|nr:glutathione S-transferase family protein [Shewanella insulae]MCG9739316.1 glutathione S-transferase family protein [Shewanella insulae]MXR68906.1 glutathione S-transferase family protein [Shewanella insulae]